MADQTTKTIIVGAPVDEVFAAWADFESFPRFMKNLVSVTRTGETRSRWVMQGPLGTKLEWDAETTMIEKGRRIGWRSVEGSAVKTSGMVTFTELGNGQTQVTLTMQWVIPPSKGGETLAELVGHPDKRVEEDLYGFKTFVEGRRAMA